MNSRREAAKEFSNLFQFPLDQFQSLHCWDLHELLIDAILVIVCLSKFVWKHLEHLLVRVLLEWHVVLLLQESLPLWLRCPQQPNNGSTFASLWFTLSEVENMLTTYGLAELRIEGDGNCQFRALADQLYQNPDYHKYVRKLIFKQLKHNRKLYEGYVPMEYKAYLKMMKRSGEWGDHVTLQAAADRFEAKVCLLTSFKDTCYIEILPKGGKFSRGLRMASTPRKSLGSISDPVLSTESQSGLTEVWLSFWSEVHYNSLYEVGEVPTRIPRKKYRLF